jgi:hypothetical protein
LGQHWPVTGHYRLEFAAVCRNCHGWSLDTTACRRCNDVDQAPHIIGTIASIASLDLRLDQGEMRQHRPAPGCHRSSGLTVLTTLVADPTVSRGRTIFSDANHWCSDLLFVSVPLGNTPLITCTNNPLQRLRASLWVPNSRFSR